MSQPFYPGKVNAVVNCVGSIRSSDPTQLPQVTQPKPVLLDRSALVNFYFQTIQRGGYIGC